MLGTDPAAIPPGLGVWVSYQGWRQAWVMGAGTAEGMAYRPCLALFAGGLEAGRVSAAVPRAGQGPLERSRPGDLLRVAAVLCLWVQSPMLGDRSSWKICLWAPSLPAPEMWDPDQARPAGPRCTLSHCTSFPGTFHAVPTLL